MRENTACTASVCSNRRKCTRVTSKPKTTVLVVDDDSSLLRALRRLLKAFDFEVLTFDRAEALLACKIPDGAACVLLDIYLPGMSGIELCQTLVAMGCNLPVILMTARDDEVTQRRAREAGALATIFKPFDEEVLIATIGRALNAS
jgi:FixJ family two-component response regulator